MPIVLPSSLPLYDQQTLADFTDDSELGPSGDIFYSLTPLKVGLAYVLHNHGLFVSSSLAWFLFRL